MKLKYLSKVILSVSLSVAAFSSFAKENIIMVIADGMGPEFVTAYRLFKDDPATPLVEPTIFDQHLVGMVSTYPAKESGYVTDSAAAATALAAGVKTYNGAIGVNVDKKPVESVLKKAKSYGMKTGVAVTSQVNHATPAAYIAHNESRKNFNQIADSYFNDIQNRRVDFDIMLGGGWLYFIREDRDLTKEFTEMGGQYIDRFNNLKNLNNQSPALGLFAKTGLPNAIDDKSNRLLAMSKTATKLLDNEQGYFLLIEASQVDWAAHDNDIATVMAEMDNLAKTLTYLTDKFADSKDTTVILTADHSTGGFTIGANGSYKWDPQLLDKLNASPRTIASKVLSGDLALSEIEKQLGFELTEQEYQELSSVYKQPANADEKGAIRKKLKQQLLAIIDNRTNTGWTTGGHTGIDVPLFAFGKHQSQFDGLMNNTDIAKVIFQLLEQSQQK